MKIVEKRPVFDSRAKDTSIVKEGEKVYRVILIVASILTVIGLWVAVNTWWAASHPPKTAAEIAAGQAAKAASSRGTTSRTPPYQVLIAPPTHLSARGALINIKYGSCAPQGRVKVVPFIPQKDGPPMRGEPFEDGPGMVSHHNFGSGTIWRYQSLTGQNVEVLCSFPVVDS